MNSPATTKRHWRIVEGGFWLLGAVLVSFAVHARMTAALAQDTALAEFRVQSETVDQALWSESRKRHFESTRTAAAGQRPVGILSIPTIGLEVAVFDGTTAEILNLGIGRVSGTASLDGAGNVALAGHRDGFFRGLKDIAAGDAIVVETTTGPRGYTVEETFVVDPEDVYVLEQRDKSELTLITCYPFYFVGSAPRRFIVRATADDGLYESQSPLETTK